MIDDLEAMIHEYRYLQRELAYETDQGLMYSIELNMENKQQDIKDYCIDIARDFYST
jgi:hypothetical protein